MDRKTALTDYIRTEIIRSRKTHLDEKEDLIGSGILDSLSILRLVSHINEEFGVKVPDEDVVYENFHSVYAINAYLQKYQ